MKSSQKAIYLPVTNTPVVPIEKNVAPLGSSQNPIRIVQQGNRYISTQHLSAEQVGPIYQYNSISNNIDFFPFIKAPEMDIVANVICEYMRPSTLLHSIIVYINKDYLK